MYVPFRGEPHAEVTSSHPVLQQAQRTDDQQQVISPRRRRSFTQLNTPGEEHVLSEAALILCPINQRALSPPALGQHRGSVQTAAESLFSFKTYLKVTGNAVLGTACVFTAKVRPVDSDVELEHL